MSVALRLVRVRMLAVFAILLILAAAAYGFAAANTVPASGAGDGSGTISGYTITGVTYTLNTDPTKIDSVKFTINPAVAGGPAPVTVKIRLDNTANWYSCTLATSNATCATTSPQATVLGATNLQVVAISN